MASIWKHQAHFLKIRHLSDRPGHHPTFSRSLQTPGDQELLDPVIDQDDFIRAQISFKFPGQYLPGVFQKFHKKFGFLTLIPHNIVAVALFPGRAILLEDLRRQTL